MGRHYCIVYNLGLFSSAGFTGRVHDLKGGAAAQLLFYIGDDTHSDILVYPEADGHEGAFCFAHGITL